MDSVQDVKEVAQEHVQVVKHVHQHALVDVKQVVLKVVTQHA